LSEAHLTLIELEAGLDEIIQSPKQAGRVEMIVCRLGVGERVVLENAQLDLVDGLIGDTWQTRGSSNTHDGSADPDAQVTVMNARAIALVAGSRDRWPLAGDQLFVDLDLSAENVPPGSRLAIGGAVIEVTDQPHTGCGSFMRRFGRDATKFVNSPQGRKLQLRGINTKVVQPGPIRVGDLARKL
jgi:MOSC domain-containing protein YiiM